MNSLQQWKQLELYSQYPSQTARDTSSEEFIAWRLSESPIPPVWRDSWSQSLSGVT